MALVRGGDGLVLTDQMRQLINKPGPLKADGGGHTLRVLYKRSTVCFNPECVSEFARKCFRGDVTGVKRMLEDGLAPDPRGRETAFDYGYASIVVLGSQHPRAGISRRANHAGTLRVLLEYGAPPSAPDIVGYTPLHLACMNPPRADLVHVLLARGADPNAQDRFGSVPLMGALQTDAREPIDALMEHGADLELGDADGVTPEEFYVKCGAPVCALIQRWKRKRAGTMTALDEKKCAYCGETEDLKFCKDCHAIRYCSKECQKTHWAFHKTRCIPFNAENTVAVTPFYEDIGPVMSLADVTRRAYGYPVGKQPARNSRSVQIPEILEGETKKVIVKIQVPYNIVLGGPTREELGDMLVFDRRRTIVCRIRKVDDPDAYMRISRTIRAKGLAGCKAYFPAEMRRTDELVVKIAEVLAEQTF